MITGIVQTPNGYFRTSIKALVLDEQKRFLLSRQESGEWSLPGGALDWGETPQECLKREVFEEMKLEPEYIADQPSYFVIAQRTGPQDWKTNAIYLVKLNHLNFSPSEECVEIRFFTKEEALKERLSQVTRNFVLQYKPS